MVRMSFGEQNDLYLQLSRTKSEDQLRRWTARPVRCGSPECASQSDRSQCSETSTQQHQRRPRETLGFDDTWSDPPVTHFESRQLLNSGAGGATRIGADVAKSREEHEGSGRKVERANGRTIVPLSSSSLRLRREEL